MYTVTGAGMRKNSLQRKTAEIQAALEEWAKKKHILKPGEQIVFSVRVERHPTVAEENFGEMSPEDFFCKERLLQFGVPLQRATRIETQLRFANRDRSGSRRQYRYATMNEFLTEFNTRRTFEHTRNLGRLCVDHIMELLRKTGFRDV